MQQDEVGAGLISTHTLQSASLQRPVLVDAYLPSVSGSARPHLLLINDGQDLHQFEFGHMLQMLSTEGQIAPLVCVGIHAGSRRLYEYGIAGTPDYAGRGNEADKYATFVLKELLPFVRLLLNVECFASVGYAGFSLGGLTALDTVWHYPDIFQVAGVFSGALWWRSRELGEGYDDDKHRIMHQLIRRGSYHQGQRFYFTTGSLDETADRNNNGVIDSIDDTLDVVSELRAKGFNTNFELCYTNYEDGSHDVATWGRAMPKFLLWGWGNNA